MNNNDSTATTAAAAADRSSSLSLPRLGAAALLALLGSLQAVRSQAQSAAYAFAPAPAFRSHEGYIALRAGLAYTDNAFLTESNTTSDTIARTGVEMDYSHESRMLALDARGAVDSLEYLNSSFGRSTYGNFDGSALWGRPSDLLQWLVRDTLGEATADPYAAPTPVNLETVNYLTTGPYLNFNFGSENRLTLFGAYSNTSYQRSPYDSHAISEGGALSHAVSDESSVSLQVTAQQVRFKNPAVAARYDENSAFAEYNGGLGRTRAKLDAGYTQIRQSGKTNGGPLLTLELDRRISYSTTVYLRARTQYSSAGQAVAGQVGGPVIGGAIPAAATASPYRDRWLGLGWTFDRARTTFSFLGAVERESYIGASTLDRRDTDLQGVLTRQLRPSLSAELTVRQTFERYASTDANLRDTLVKVSVSKEFRRARFSLYYQRNHQSGTGNGSNVVALFDENEAGLDFTFDLIGQRAE